MKILHLEDDAGDAELIQATLAFEGLEAEWKRVWTHADYVAALQQGRFDLILADYSLPGFDGLSALALAQAHAVSAPFIFVSGALGEETAIETLRNGATDYVLKGRLNRLAPAVRRALREAEERRERQRAEAAVHAERERLRITLASIGDAVIATDTQGRVTFMNAVAESLTGWSQALAAGQAIQTVFHIVNEGTRTNVESPVDKVMREGAIAGLANHTLLISKDGHEIPIDDSGAPIRDEAGQLMGVILVFRDITERKQAEAAQEDRVRQQAAVVQMGFQALSGLGKAALMNEVVRSLAETLGVEFTKVLELVPDSTTLRICAGVGWKEGVVGHTLVEAGPASQAGHTLLSNTPVIVSDLKHETRFVGMPVLHEHGVVSGMTVVIPGRERPYGVLGVHTAHPRRFTAADANFLQAVANVLAEAVERQRAEEALRVSRNQLATILDGLAEGVTVQNPDGQLMYANELAAQVIGFPSAEVLLATPIQEFMHNFEMLDEAGRPFPVAQLPGRRALLGEPNPSALIRFRVRDTGEEHWATVKARPILNREGQVERAVNIFNDITELKRAERSQWLLAEASRALASSLNYQTRLINVAELVASTLSDWCIVDLIEKDGSLRQVAVAHVNPAQASLVRELRRRYPPHLDEFHPILRVIRTGNPEFSPEIMGEQLRARARDEQHLQLLRSLGIRSHIVMPLVARGRTLGAISFVLGESGRRYKREDLALAEDLAQRVALALDNALLYAEAQRLNAELEARVEERTEELQVALEEIRTTNEELEKEVLERRQAEEKIRQSERRLTEAQQMAQLGSWRWEVAANTMHWSDELYQIYGVNPKTYSATFAGLLELVHPEDREFVRQQLDQTLQNHQPFIFDHRLVRPDGTVRTLQTRGEVEGLGQRLTLIGTSQDVTVRKQMENELRESREQLRQLSAHLQAAREEERKHMAREIHDELGGTLSGLKMDVIQLQKKADAITAEALVEKTRALAMAIDATVKTVRRIATNLRPSVLDDLGLIAAIEWQLEEFQNRWGIQSQLTSHVDDIPLSPEGSIAVFRVFQETLTNVARHAQATRVEVILEQQADYLVLQVRDNGRGISTRALRARNSLGLLGMRERLHLLAGELDIQSVPGQGTAVLVKIPLGKNSANSNEARLG